MSGVLWNLLVDLLVRRSRTSSRRAETPGEPSRQGRSPAMRIRERGGDCVQREENPEAALGLSQRSGDISPGGVAPPVFDVPPVSGRRSGHAPDHGRPVWLGAGGGESGDSGRSGQGAEFRPELSARDAVRNPSRGRWHRGLSRGNQGLEQWQGQRAVRRPRLVCRFQQPADAGLLSRLRYHEPRSLVRVPDRRGCLRAGLARLGAGLLLPAERNSDHREEWRCLAPSRRSSGHRPGSSRTVHTGG